MVLCGFSAGGSAGNASLPAPPVLTGPTPLEAGLETGGVGRADPGFEFCADEEDCGTQVDLLEAAGREDEGRPGNASTIEFAGRDGAADCVEAFEAEPQERF